jgi:5-methylcytosine-specific restriction endonuclease McrA
MRPAARLRGADPPGIGASLCLRWRDVRTLVLNAGYEPLAVVSFRRALVLVLAGKATIVAEDADPVVTSSVVLARPSVILLGRYVRASYGRSVPVSRRGVLRRDAHRCAYCARGATTVDHVVPRSRGGLDTWTNLVACCIRCNGVKGDRTPEEMGWVLQNRPYAPRGPAWVVRGAETRDPRWEEFLGDAA